MGCLCSVPTTKCTEYSKGECGIVICDGKCGQTGKVWGSGPYTADSCVCQAARHAGVIDANGGAFKVTIGGPGSYTGTTKNGVTTADYGHYDSSFTVEKVSF